jgi:hypothetical protein
MPAGRFKTVGRSFASIQPGVAQSDDSRVARDMCKEGGEQNDSAQHWNLHRAELNVPTDNRRCLEERRSTVYGVLAAAHGRDLWSFGTLAAVHTNERCISGCNAARGGTG